MGDRNAKRRGNSRRVLVFLLPVAEERPRFAPAGKMPTAQPAGFHTSAGVKTGPFYGAVIYYRSALTIEWLGLSRPWRKNFRFTRHFRRAQPADFCSCT